MSLFATRTEETYGKLKKTRSTESRMSMGPDETSFVEERSRLERMGGDSNDIVCEEEEIGRNLMEIGVFVGKFGGG